MTPHRLGLSEPGDGGIHTNAIPTTEGSSILIALTRMEAKVDVALAQHGQRLESAEADISDHEARIRTIEAKPTVSPGKLWAVVSGGAALILAVMQILERMTT